MRFALLGRCAAPPSPGPALAEGLAAARASAADAASPDHVAQPASPPDIERLAAAIKTVVDGALDAPPPKPLDPAFAPLYAGRPR